MLSRWRYPAVAALSEVLHQGVLSLSKLLKFVKGIDFQIGIFEGGSKVFEKFFIIVCM